MRSEGCEGVVVSDLCAAASLREMIVVAAGGPWDCRVRTKERQKDLCKTKPIRPRGKGLGPVRDRPVLWNKAKPWRSGASGRDTRGERDGSTEEPGVRNKANWRGVKSEV